MQGAGSYGKVFKALRGGVQDVAVKQLLHTEDGQLESFVEASALFSSCFGLSWCHVCRACVAAAHRVWSDKIPHLQCSRPLC